LLRKRIAVSTFVEPFQQPQRQEQPQQQRQPQDPAATATTTAMAIVHVVFKSSSKAPPAGAHAQYIAREGQYQGRGGLELVEHGNMPEFAQADPLSFWEAADTHERVNGRTYTELQFALPRELDPAQRQELAREATRELLGDRFAYTLAVHAPLAKDNIEQPHMHLMFSERAIDSNTQSLSEERFFKRNGAKKDPAWNDRNKPEEVRGRWVEMMNGAMQKAGIEQRLDARSWVDQGREDLAALREEKTLQGNGFEALERGREIDDLRVQRAELPAPHLDRTAAIQSIDHEAEKQVAQVRERETQELSRLDRLIAAARELAVEVKQFAVNTGQNLADRIAQFRARFEGRGESQAGTKPVQNLETQAAIRPPEGQGIERASPGVDAWIEEKRQALRDRYEAQKQAREPAVVPEPPAKEMTPEKKPEQELEIKRDRGLGHGR
jgi:hypothetical protein